MTCDQWPVVWPCELPPDASEPQTQAAISGAQTILWSRTGRRVGSCSVVERYSLPGGNWCGAPLPHGFDSSGQSVRGGFGMGYGFECCALVLESQPVQSVTQVKVDGVVVDPAGYLLSGASLRRIGAHWPRQHHPHDVPRIEVTYVWGIPVDNPGSDDPADKPALWGLASAAMGEVAMELLNGMCGGACKLPSRTVTITRRNVTVNLGAPGEYADKGRLGLPIADQFIDSVNPTHKAARSRVYSPDLAQRSR